MPEPRVADAVYYYPNNGEVNYLGQTLGARVCRVNDDGTVNLQIDHPAGCGCFFRRDIPRAEAANDPGTWAPRD